MDQPIESQPRFQHTPLADPNKQMRVLRLLPGSDNEVIACELEVWPLGTRQTNDDGSTEKWSDTDAGSSDPDHDTDEDIGESAGEFTGEDGYEYTEDSLTEGAHLYADGNAINDANDNAYGDEVGYTSGQSYYAISYTWGEKVERHLYINDQVYYVRQNCYYALWQARLRHAGEFVWIDSICIDQESNREKSAQVGKMWDIFGQSHQVLACVGEHADNSEHLIKVYKSSSERARPNGIDPHHVSDYYHAWATQLSKLLGVIGAKQFHKALTVFSLRPYWNRLWIVQEISAAKLARRPFNVLCGRNCVPREAMELFDALASHLYFDRHRLIPREAFKYFKSSLHRIISRILTERGLGLEEGFTYFYHSQCTDPRDAVFALLNVIKQNDHVGRFRELDADYSLSALAVLLRVAPLLADAAYLRRAVHRLGLAAAGSQLEGLESDANAIESIECEYGAITGLVTNASMPWDLVVTGPCFLIQAGQLSSLVDAQHNKGISGGLASQLLRVYHASCASSSTSGEETGDFP